MPTWVGDHFFMSAVGLANPSPDQISINGPFKIANRNGNQNLMVGASIWLQSIDDLNRVQIKRGTLFKEFLYCFLFREPFCL